MLKKLRKKKVAKWGLIVLTTVIVFAFVFWGSSSLIRDRKSQQPLGTLFGKPVNTDDFQNALLAARNLAVMRYGDNYSEVADYLNLEAQAWERLILLYETARRRLKVSDKEVIEEIQKMAFFQKDGAFDKQRYNQLTQYVFQVPARLFEEHIRENLLISKLYEQITSSTVVSDEEIKEEYEKQNMELSVSYIAAFPSDFTDGINPGENELNTYYSENSVSFKKPLSFRIKYISAQSRELIRDAYERLVKSKDIDKLAAELNLEVKETDFFEENDPIPGIGWDPRVNKMLAELDEGDIAVPFGDEDAYYLIKVTQRKSASIPPFEELKDEVKQQYIQTHSVRKAREKITQAYDALKEYLLKNPVSPDLRRYAREYGLKYDSTGLFKFRSYIEGIGSSDLFWLAAKDLKEGEISGIINASSGFFIISAKEKIPIDEETFEGEKESFKEDLVAAKKQERFSVFLRSLTQSAAQ